MTETIDLTIVDSDDECSSKQQNKFEVVEVVEKHPKNPPEAIENDVQLGNGEDLKVMSVSGNVRFPVFCILCIQ